jgi:hypothetical protein
VNRGGGRAGMPPIRRTVTGGIAGRKSRTYLQLFETKPRIADKPTSGWDDRHADVSEMRLTKNRPGVLRERLSYRPPPQPWLTQ